jgi:molybdopterin/thiamine biosynthesis adenylyltransferase
MTISSPRFDRNIRLFGKLGQSKLARARVAMVGVGGLGSAIAQHLALLGVGQIVLIDPEELDESNRNRFIGARASDPVPGTSKTEIVSRLVHEIDPAIETECLNTGLVSSASFDAVRNADWVVGSFDDDGPRYILNELTRAYLKPYIDTASDVLADGAYGGRVCFLNSEAGCLHCLDLLDAEDVRDYLSNFNERRIIAGIYGVTVRLLGSTGPSVSPINGVIAGIAAMELMVAITGLRAPTRLVKYDGNRSRVVVSTDRPSTECHICNDVRGSGAAADVERYLRMPHLQDRMRGV